MGCKPRRLTRTPFTSYSREVAIHHEAAGLRATQTGGNGRTGGTAALRHYIAYGLRWHSAIALPFATSPTTAGVPEVVVRLGSTPSDVPRRGGTPHAFRAVPGAALLAVEGIARYYIAPSEIVVHPEGGDERDIAAFLIGPASAALLQMRGVVTLHAAAVEMGGRAVLLLGSSGAGKSALAAALVRRGHALLADDVSGLTAANGAILVPPAFPALRLWHDALGASERRAQVRRNLAQYWQPATTFAAAPHRLRAAFVLESHNRAVFDLERLPPSRAFRAVWRHTYRKRLVDALGQRQAHYGIAMALAQKIPFVRVQRPEHPFRLAALADRIEAQVGSVPPGIKLTTPRRAPNPNARRARTTSKTPGSGIVWIAAYPKSGTTWTRAVLTNYLQDDGEPASINALVGGWGVSNRSNFDELIGIDSVALRPDELERYLPAFREMLARSLAVRPPDGAIGGGHGRQPHFAKTHEAYRGPVGGARFPANGAARVIYLTRNPLDVAVSYAHHLQRSIDQTIQWMNDPAADEAPALRNIRKLLPSPLTTWSNHVSSWLAQKAMPMHSARYEDLLADPHAGFGAIVRFAGLAWDRARLNRAIKNAAFRRLQAQEAESGYGERQQTAPSFFRAGVAGSWRTALTREQVRAVVDAHGTAMRQLGYLREAEAFLRGTRTCGTLSTNTAEQ